MRTGSRDVVAPLVHEGVLFSKAKVEDTVAMRDAHPLRDADHGDLMAKFVSLPCPCMCMYGEQNSSLSYLPTLNANGVDLAEIPHSGHWPMYSNPVAMWEHIARFHSRRTPS